MDPVLTFTSDFGLHDSYVGQVKGVLASCVPGIRIVDITHQVDAGNLAAGSFALAGAYTYFPAGTLHLVVIDPGVGTERDILYIESTSCRFVGPDNGVLAEAAEAAGAARIHALDLERFTGALRDTFAGNPVVEQLLREPSTTFHGRDLFAPLCGYLLAGGDPGRVTRPKKNMHKLDLPVPEHKPGRTTGQVVYVDGFGNLVTNIPAGWVDPRSEVFIVSGGHVRSVGTLQHTYGSVERGETLALIGSRGLLEIGVNGGSAASVLSAGYGDGVLIIAETERS
jgi:hypothetical protein